VSWFLAFAGFAALIVLHEFGHFVAAKAVGMRVERFSLFFGPMFAKVRRGETVYGIGVVPLGGYVKISGMNPHEELPPEVAPRAYYRQKPWKRIVVILAGPAMNVLIAFVILWTLFVFHGPYVSTDRVDTIQKGSPAATVLRPGDHLLAVDGVRGPAAALRRQISSHRCAGAQRDGCRAANPARLLIKRGARTVTVDARPRYSATDKRPLLGFVFAVAGHPEGAGAGSKDAVTGMWRVTTGTVSAISRLFYSAKARKQVSGVVGSYEATRQAISFNGIDALNILAIISLSLAIVNLFPFLPLDGGHVFWALAEKVRGRAISFSVMERAGVIGFLLIAFLFVVGLTNDIDRLRGEGFGVR
jgi:regulator of sigma E protease